MFDVFYLGEKPGIFAHEQRCDTVQHAHDLCRTRFFWIIDYLVDYRDFDFLWMPAPWEQQFRHAWPSQWHPDSGTYLIPVQGYQDTKYHRGPVLNRRPASDHWEIPEWVDPASVDMSWHPDPRDPPFVYHFASNYQASSGVIYRTPGAMQEKFITDLSIKIMPSKQNWVVPDYIDPSSVDFSWRPNFMDPPCQYHFASQHQRSSGVIYAEPGANTVSFCDSFCVLALPSRDNWYLPSWIDDSTIDFSWHPDALDPVMNYHFATRAGWSRVGGPEYRVPGALETKYLDTITAGTRGDAACWRIPPWIDPSSIDPSWCPCPVDPPYIYEFPVEWGWDHVGGPEYHVPGATQRKYVQDFVARTQPDPSNFQVLDHLDPRDDVFRWRPDPTAPPMIYIFGNQWWPAEKRASAVYTVNGATITQYMSEPRRRRQALQDHYHVIVPDVDFDFSWEPDPGDPPFVYVFGNQWHTAEIMPTVEYHVPGATERKFVQDLHAVLTSTNDDRWRVLVPCEWDKTWVPDPGDPAYIYVFGNQWHTAEIMPTVEYHVPGATERKFMQDLRAELPQDPSRWTVPEDVNAQAIDYSWCPDPGSPAYIYHFGTEHQSSVGVIYTVPGAHEIKFAGDIPRRDQQQQTMITLDCFYIDYSNALSSQRLQALQESMPHLQRVRYANSLLDTLRRCARRAKTPRFWALSSQNDYKGFDFTWHPEIWQRGMIHVFGTQWSKWSDTFLINRWEFDRQSPWQTRIEDFYNLNFVTDQQVRAATDAADIIVIDHGNTQRNSVIADLESRPGRVVRSARYFDNYLDTLRRVIDADIGSQHVWICSTLCDYAKFDFSWQPEAWQRDMIHVFASGDNKFGDTFLIPVEAWRRQQQSLELLDWFETVNYVPGISVPRWPMPVIQHQQDTQVDEILCADFTAPLMLFSSKSRDQNSMPTVSIWRENTETIVPLDRGAETVIVPRRAVSRIRTQLYDYPHIDRTHRDTYTCDGLDIVFISNGEPNAEQNWQHLEMAVSGIAAGLHRIDGVNGRVAAYQAAAQASRTPWFFAVFAKLKVDAEFDWHWQPDRMQQPKHYIFHARNPVNDLVYGHQAVIAYNRNMVMSNPGLGLDFTLDQPHDVVPILSGVAHYNQTAWMAWRTAFREVLKLRHSLPDLENQYRIQQWLSEGQGINCVWSQRGAEDAVEYYQQVSGDFSELRKSYEWSWLASYALSRRNLTPDQ